MKIYVVGGSVGYASFIKNATITDFLEEADIVLFTGGEDVDPSLYNKTKHAYTMSNLDRDLYEKSIFEQVKPTQLCVGICRGSQFLCVMNGGILVQHCNNHATGCCHTITNGKTIYTITSTHHQMQYPFNLPDSDYDILFISHSAKSTIIQGDGVNDDVIYSKGNPEIVLYHKEGLPKCLAIQGHPEMMPNSPVSSMLNNLIKKLTK